MRHLRNAANPAEHVTETEPIRNENVGKDLLHYRFVYPEFLPDPKIEFRNKLREKLERQDMIARRSQLDIPEFYVGEF